MNLLSEVHSGGLIWFPEKGYGYVHPVREIVYGEGYFDEYEARAQNDMSYALMDARSSLVAKYTNEIVVDIGTGSCAFIDVHTGHGRPAAGYDINPGTVHRLIERDQFWNPYERKVVSACFWDTLEHFEDPKEILDCVEGLAFISIPIVEGPFHCLTSKHFKPGEHLWYFTDKGLIKYMGECGFVLREENRIEEDIGREEIGTFVFERMEIV